MVDTVSGAEAEDFDRLAYNGQLVTIVGVPNVDSDDMFGRGLSMAVVNLGGAWLRRFWPPTIWAQWPPTCLRWHRRAVLDPLIERILPFAELVDPLKTLATGKVTGKLVVSLDISRLHRRFGMARAAWCMEFPNTAPRGFPFVPRLRMLPKDVPREGLSAARFCEHPWNCRRPRGRPDHLERRGGHQILALRLAFAVDHGLDMHHPSLAGTEHGVSLMQYA